MPDHTAPGPLAGLRVVDCSTVLAGPYCTMLLGDLGADVVKVEPPEGDATRGWGPPWIGPAGGDGARTAAYYLAVNRNKRSLRLDLRTPDGKAVLRRLLAEGDVVVENFRVGGFARLGFDDDELARLNPRLVHLAISGYGTRGAAASRPGYDFVIQAASGLMSITGATDEDGGEPTKVGVAISDVVTGMLGAVGLLAALVGRGDVARGGEAGGGQRVDVSILGATLASLVNQAQNAFATDRAPGRLGNAHPSIVPYESFATTDGAIAIAVGSGRQWVRLCDALAIPDRAAGHLRRLQRGQPLGSRAGAEAIGKDRPECAAVVDAVPVRREPGIVGPIGDRERVAQPDPLATRPNRDRDRAIGRGERLVRDDARVGVAVERRLLAHDEGALRHVDQRRERRVD